MPSILEEMNNGLAEIIDVNTPIVVRISGSGRKHPFTGILWNEEGAVVTTAHSVSGAGELTVAGPEGSSAAETAGIDPRFDCAVLRTDIHGPAPRFSDGAALRPGNLVLAMGRPGTVIRAALGMISLRAESFTTPRGGELDFYIEVDGSLPRGFSGGPLVDTTGAVIGMNSSLPRGTGMTVPTGNITESVRTILEKGAVRNYHIGITMQPIILPGEGRRSGLLILGVETGSPAERVPLYLGDTLLAANGRPLYDVPDLHALLSTDNDGLVLETTILRAGKEEQVTVRPERREEN